MVLVLACPRVPDVAVQLCDIICLFLPNPEKLIDGVFPSRRPQSDDGKLLGQIVAIDDAEALDGIRVRSVGPLRPDVLALRGKSVVENISAHICEDSVCSAHDLLPRLSVKTPVFPLLLPFLQLRPRNKTFNRITRREPSPVSTPSPPALKRSFPAASHGRNFLPPLRQLRPRNRLASISLLSTMRKVSSMRYSFLASSPASSRYPISASKAVAFLYVCGSTLWGMEVIR